MLVNLETLNHTDLELLYGKMVINTMENGWMVKVTEMEPNYGMTDENI